MVLKEIKRRLFFGDDVFPIEYFDLFFVIVKDKLYYKKPMIIIDEIVKEVKENKTPWTNLLFYWLNDNNILYQYIGCMLRQKIEDFNSIFDALDIDTFSLEGNFDGHKRNSLRKIIQYSFLWSYCDDELKSDQFKEWRQVNNAWRDFININYLSNITY